jgi:NTP pyrophosphatase (non-canonical NTP hydrolase)
MVGLMISKELTLKATEIWGLERQINMCIEEVGEFLQAWNKIRRNKITNREYVEEMVDCYIMFSQMRHIYGDLFEEILKSKLERVTKKIKAKEERKVNDVL